MNVSHRSFSSFPRLYASCGYPPACTDPAKLAVCYRGVYLPSSFSAIQTWALCKDALQRSVKHMELAQGLEGNGPYPRFRPLPVLTQSSDDCGMVPISFAQKDIPEKVPAKQDDL